jgi:hypothetical protein
MHVSRQMLAIDSHFVSLLKTFLSLFCEFKRIKNLSLTIFSLFSLCPANLESALGSSYRQLVRARFTRSFLAQLIGLRVHYKHFEQDDPGMISFFAAAFIRG